MIMRPQVEAAVVTPVQPTEVVPTVCAADVLRRAGSKTVAHIHVETIEQHGRDDTITTCSDAL